MNFLVISKVKKIFFLLLIFISFSACSRIEKRGYAFEYSDHNFLQEGVTDKEMAFQIMGSPTLVSYFDQDEVWIYYAEDIRDLLFLNPKAVKREILVVKFDENDLIKNLQKISLDHERKSFNFASDFTAVDDHKTSLIKSFFSNVGQVRPQ